MQPGRGAKFQDIVATVATITVHAIAIGFLLLNLNITGALDPEQNVVEPIPAEMVDEVAIQAAQEQQKQEERRQQREQAERQAQLAQAEREAEARRQAEIRRQREDEARREAAEQAKREAAEQAKREAAQEAKRQAAADAKREAAEQAKREAAQEAKRQAAADAKREAAEQAKREAAEQAKRKAAEEAHKLAQRLADQEAAKNYAENVIAPHVKRRWNPLSSSQGGLVCLLRISLTSSGEVTSVQIVRGSGDSLFDNSALAAAHRASPLPMPSNPSVVEELRPSFILRFKPE